MRPEKPKLALSLAQLSPSLSIFLSMNELGIFDLNKLIWTTWPDQIVLLTKIGLTLRFFSTVIAELDFHHDLINLIHLI